MTIFLDELIDEQFPPITLVFNMITRTGQS